MLRGHKNASLTRDPRIDPQRGDEMRCGGLLRRVLRREGEMLWYRSGGIPYQFRLQQWQKWYTAPRPNLTPIPVPNRGPACGL